MAMHLNVIGSSPAWPNPGGAHSGYLLEAGGKRLLLDCGPGVLSRLRQAEGWPRIDAIAITHFHLDHWGDLVPWVWGSSYRSQEEPTRSRSCGSTRAGAASSNRSAVGSASPTCSSGLST